MHSRSNFRAYLLIVLGICFLSSKQGWLPDLAPLISDWWPLILIVLGAAMLLRRSHPDQS